MISKTTFKGIKESNTKLDILYDMLYDTQEEIVKLNARKYWDTTYAGLAGMLAAVTTVLGKTVFWK